MLNLKLSKAKNTDHRRSPTARFYRFLSSEVPTGQTNSWADKKELPTAQTNI